MNYPFQAITLNGVAVEANKQAFAGGRVLAARGPAQPEAPTAGQLAAEPLAALIEKRVALLTDYQNASYAAGYRRFVEECAAAERRALGNACQSVFVKAWPNRSIASTQHWKTAGRSGGGCEDVAPRSRA